jgi:hypothetical protein
MVGLPNVFDGPVPLVQFVAPPALSAWFEQRVITDPAARTGTTILYRDYCRWAEDSDREHVSMAMFGRALTRMGIRGFASDGIKRIGIRLRSEGI